MTAGIIQQEKPAVAGSNERLEGKKKDINRAGYACEASSI